MTEAQDCLDKAGPVSLGYYPPTPQDIPKDCRRTIFSKPPELNANKMGFEFICAIPYTQDAGGVFLLFRVRAWLDFELSFVNTNDVYVKEIHTIALKMPFILKLAGPQ